MLFEDYLQKLAQKEMDNGSKYLIDPRKKILVTSGIHLNWLGDFFANPKYVWKKRIFKLEEVVLTGMNEKLNEILIKRCKRDPYKVIDLIESDEVTRDLVKSEASDNEDLIILRENNGKYWVLDGMHRILKKLIEREEKFLAYYPENLSKELPICEPHVVYDLIRGFIRNANDVKGQEQLYNALSLLVKTYGNVLDLLKNRFGPDRVFETEVQQVIQRVVKES